MAGTVPSGTPGWTVLRTPHDGGRRPRVWGFRPSLGAPYARRQGRAIGDPMAIVEHRTATEVGCPRPAPSPVTRWASQVDDGRADSGLARRADAVAKRSMDVVLSAVALVLLAPVLLVVALAITVGDGGPVLFRQVRVGRDGRIFTMHKFRSMTVDAEERRAALIQLSDGNGVLFKMHTDPRVTPVGRFLRRYCLDELPQFWDALRGHMSVVGPRPALPEEVACYDTRARRRLAVKPGITGAWQISGRSDLPWSDCVSLDLDYVEHRSLGRDVVIVLRTVGAVLRADGAY